MRRTANGFTIVELLIVIVVIAILAAITIVAYNGIQTRAENTKSQNATATYVKIFSLYAADKGVYPSTSLYPCIGAPSSGTCGRVSGSGGCNYAGTATTSSAFNTSLLEYASSLPSLSEQKIACTGSEVYAGGFINANNTDPKSLTFAVFFKQLSSCPLAGAAKVTATNISNEVTRCNYTMPAL